MPADSKQADCYTGSLNPAKLNMHLLPVHDCSNEAIEPQTILAKHLYRPQSVFLAADFMRLSLRQTWPCYHLAPAQ